MDTVRVIHDRKGATLTVWFGDSAQEAVSSMNDDGVLVMRDGNGRVLGVEVMGYHGRPGAVALELSGVKTDEAK